MLLPRAKPFETGILGAREPSLLACPTFEYPFYQPIPVLSPLAFGYCEPDNLPAGLFKHDTMHKLPHYDFTVLKGWADQLGGDYSKAKGGFNDKVPLRDLACYFFILKASGYIEKLPQSIPWFSREDVARNIVRENLEGVPTPLARFDGEYPLSSLSSSMAILYYLELTSLVQDHCDPEKIAESVLHLQERDGHFRNVKTRDSYDHEDCNTQLLALVTLGLLDEKFNLNSIHAVDAVALRRWLLGRLRELQQSSFDPDDLYRIRSLVAAFQILQRAGGDSAEIDNLALDATIMKLFGLENVWAEFKGEYARQKHNSLEAGLRYFPYDMGLVINTRPDTITRKVTEDYRQKIREFQRIRKRVENSPFFSWGDRSFDFSLFGAFASLVHLKYAAAAALVCNAYRSFATGDDRHLFGVGSTWEALMLSYFYKHLPILHSLDEPVLWFKGARHVSISVRNGSAQPVHDMRCEWLTPVGPAIRVPKSSEQDSSIEFSSESWRSGRPFHVQVKGSKLEPTSLIEQQYGAVQLKLQRQSGPSYLPPFDHFPGPVIVCKYQGQDHAMRAPTQRVCMVPNRAVVEQVLEQELAKERNKTLALEFFRQIMHDQYGAIISEEVADRIYREFFPSSYQRWISQFSPDEAEPMSRLYKALHFYTTAQVLHSVRARLSSGPICKAARAALFVGIGRHQGKSGPHLLYHVKHAFRDIFPRCDPVEVALRFQHPSALANFIKTHPEARSLAIDRVIFVDDFLGSGGTAIKEIRQFKKQYRKLDYPAYLIAITGFERARNDILEALPDLRIVTADRRLTERDRAFSPENNIFQSDRQRKCAKRACERIGNELLKEMYPDLQERKLHVLGYKKGQALVVFEHNTPNNTLPIFWSDGSYDGKPWYPLWKRKD